MISKRKKQLVKWIFVCALIGAIVYTFRDQAGPILSELRKTTPEVIAGICVLTILYHMTEGLITTVLAKKYNPHFTYWMGVTNAFFCSFYRVATLGGGAGVAAIVYLGEHGVGYSKSFGLYMLQYAFHKISIAIFSLVLSVACWHYMYAFFAAGFASYQWLLVAGYALTLVITLLLVAFCCSERLHRMMFCFLDWMNQKQHGRMDASLGMLREQCFMLEEASREIMGDRLLVAGMIALSMVRNCFWYAIPYLIFRGTCEISLPQTMAVTSLSVMLAAVLPAPAGIGSTEFVFTALFSGIAGTALSGSASLLYRFGTFVFPFFIGMAVVLVRRVRARRQTCF